MSDKLQLTYAELELIVSEDLERFKTLYNDIPRDGHSSNYIEDDGRQYRSFKFEDLETGKTYDFSYTWHSEWGYDFPLSFLGGEPEGIEFVPESVLFPKEPVKVVVPELTPEEKADKEVWDAYNDVASKNEMSKNKFPKAVVKEAVDFVNKTKFTMHSLRQKLIPLCTEHKLDHQAFWNHIQVKRGAWKKPKI